MPSHVDSQLVYDNIGRDEIQKLFPSEKFQREWRQDVLKDQGALPRLKTMTWDMVNPDAEFADPVAVINLKFLNDSQLRSKESEVKFELAYNTLEIMLNSMYSIRDLLSNVWEVSNVYLSQDANMLKITHIPWIQWYGLAQIFLVIPFS
ncbi:unnamed protein product [Prunus armeniaca]|uniref:Uncharacterized protein n=1 Tax=Prunus armeniaca TaxID=36596 RepID=A0A6J5W1I9_PRUAR|nr:unnamed protein product [Prunus armeniaca]